MIHTAVRVHRKPKRWPKGWTYFLQRMEEANIPQILLGSGTQFKVEQDMDEEGDDDDVGEEKIKDECIDYPTVHTFNSHNPTVAILQMRIADLSHCAQI